MTSEQAAALGRMGYGLRCLVSGWRMQGELIDLVIRVLCNELINLAAVLCRNDMVLARRLIEDAMDGAWKTVMEQNPNLKPDKGGN